MKKKIFLIAAIGLLCLTACTKNEFNVGVKSDTQITKRDILLEIKENTLTDTGLTLIMKNNSINDVLYGEDYKLEIKENGTWYNIDVEINFISIGYAIKSKETKELVINWENSYGKLASGDYRIIKSVSYNGNAEYKNDFYISAEFKIDK